MADQLMLLPQAAIDRKRYKPKRGHAGYPGEGPKGEFCKTCIHIVNNGRYGGRSYFKCALTNWTNGKATDIKANDPACGKWEGLRALSIRQPWPWAILNLGKDIENRSQNFKRRGPILIHASLTIDEQAVIDLRAQGYELPTTFKTGGIVGKATITDCVSEHSSEWFTGPYGLVLTDAKTLPFRPCKGAQSFFVPKWEDA
ncbi:hypothetical protein [Magnetovibrio sp.]|uniref:hypothetical protein n=1 Tax=Magnetovibrio sp. TaxID=2024836 RepID=UPI002F91D153